MPEVGLSPNLNYLNPAIYGAGQAAVAREAAAKAKESAESAGKRTVFSRLLKQSAEPISALAASEAEDADLGAIEVTTESIAAFMEDVESAGDALAERPVEDNILRYKKSVRRFMRFVEINAFEARNEALPQRPFARFKAGGKPNIKTILSVVDQKLERLAADIMSGHAKKMHLLESLEEIKGLLVDLSQ
jgi:uncharacterized protein YaaR (DUF327 family)